MFFLNYFCVEINNVIIKSKIQKYKSETFKVADLIARSFTT